MDGAALLLPLGLELATVVAGECTARAQPARPLEDVQDVKLRAHASDLPRFLPLLAEAVAMAVATAAAAAAMAVVVVVVVASTKAREGTGVAPAVLVAVLAGLRTPTMIHLRSRPRRRQRSTQSTALRTPVRTPAMQRQHCMQSSAHAGPPTRVQTRKH